MFCCSVPVVGITNLQTLLESMPPYWAGFAEFMYRSYGDPRTPEGRALLAERSPIHKVDRIKKPMLIFHGANDVRCKIAESDTIVAAMQAKGIPVTYVVYPDEGHGFQNRRTGCPTSRSPRRSSRAISAAHASRLAAISRAPATRSVLAPTSWRTPCRPADRTPSSAIQATRRPSRSRIHAHDDAGDVAFGSFASIRRCRRYVRLCSKSGDKADIAGLRICANSGREQMQQHPAQRQL